MSADLSAILNGDFRIPFYENSQKSASLMLYLDDEAQAPISVTVSLFDPSGEHVLKSVERNLNKGENRCELNIDGFASGRYPVSIKANSPETSGELKRLLRIDNGSSVSPLVPGMDVTGKKLFLMDDYHVESRSGLTVEKAQVFALSFF